jgi:hypothetical protein
LLLRGDQEKSVAHAMRKPHCLDRLYPEKNDRLPTGVTARTAGIIAWKENER